ncbi:MAG: D-alanyl-lipoteichoic acid biosynthesis protein DltB [Chthoniobacteraceae bacterium]
MLPYGDFTYFGLLLYVVVPTIALGLLGRAGWRWTLCCTALVLAVQLSAVLKPILGIQWREVWLFVAFGAWQTALAFALLRWRGKFPGWIALALAVLPLLLVKVAPFLPALSALKFLGLSYITFRALDVIFSIRDGVIKQLSLTTWLGYLLFFPTISSGPIDRYRRFEKDWLKPRTRAEFLDDLDFAIARTFRGFLYKFIIAALIHAHLLKPLDESTSALALAGYAYAYTLYLFFDFAGYSAFAIGLSRVFGIRTPENFDRPFLSRNIRDFWNRWHISLSFWFRDHIYMRFLLAAAKAKWFKGRHTANYLGLYLTFGLMGFWHGLSWHYILYGLYHATLLCGYDWFARWNKARNLWPDTPFVRGVNIALTFHAFAFGLLLFSGKLTH